MRTKKISIRVNERTWNQIKEVADYLDQDISSVLRNSLRFGLNSLLKFETAGTMDLKKLAANGIAKEANDTIDQENYKPKPLSEEEAEILKRQIELANVKHFTPDEKD